MNFDLSFWIEDLTKENWPLNRVSLDVETLRIAQGVFSTGFEAENVELLFASDRIEVAFVKVKSSSLTRGRCSDIARRWKQRRMVRPFLLFSDGVDCIAAVVPGVGTSGEVKLLSLSGELYRTDREVIASTRHPGNEEELIKRCDTEFFPFEKVRDDFFQGYRDLYARTELAVRPILGEASSAYAQRWLGRLLFLYFLQRKGWLNGDRKYVNGIKDYLNLNLVFYEYLANETNSGLPFLNGSLFEKESYIDAAEPKLALVVNPIFQDARRFFNGFNFTIDESAPLDIDVSIDPALIGTIFENMLPENKRGSTGTFYTPRNEVSFICRRARAQLPKVFKLKRVCWCWVSPVVPSSASRP